LILYFSQGGTTTQVAESIAAGLLVAGYQVYLHDMQVGRPPDPRGYDLLGIGSPTYHFRAPYSVLDCVHALPDLNGLPAFVFVLYGALGGDAGNDIRRALAGKDARDVGYLRCPGANYYLPYLKQGYLFSPGQPSGEELAQAEKFGRQVAVRVKDQDYAVAMGDPTPAAIYRLQRFLVQRWLVEQIYSRLFRVDRDRCTACGLCIQECPTGNIAQDSEGYPDWGRNCLLCLYCEMNCPAEAVSSPATGLLFLPFIKYNVGHASRDPAVDYVRVKHNQGQTQQL
jgi:flavodoxin/ferredoxin